METHGNMNFWGEKWNSFTRIHFHRYRQVLSISKNTSAQKPNKCAIKKSLTHINSQNNKFQQKGTNILLFSVIFVAYKRWSTCNISFILFPVQFKQIVNEYVWMWAFFVILMGRYKRNKLCKKEIWPWVKFQDALAIFSGEKSFKLNCAKLTR